MIDSALPPQSLDDLDRRIVAALQVDPRATWGQIGTALAVSQTTVLRRTQRLRDSGVLVILGAPDPLLRRPADRRSRRHLRVLAPDHRYLSQVLLHELPDTGEIISTATEVVRPHDSSSRPAAEELSAVREVDSIPPCQATISSCQQGCSELAD